MEFKFALQKKFRLDLYSTVSYQFLTAFTRNEVRIAQYLRNPVEVPVVVLSGCCGEHSLTVPVLHLPHSRWRRIDFSGLKFVHFVLMKSGFLKPVIRPSLRYKFFYHSCGSPGSNGSAYRSRFRILILLRQK